MPAYVPVCSVPPPPGEACPVESITHVDVFTALTPEDLGIDAETIAYVFGWGFGAVVFAWFLGYVIGVALHAIRKA